ncbi:hypothetical protein Lalb_Chr17g0345481 [Lupinus albus]|uniref:Uncharacterized protein n=1 Tax=Lupinus albus TaxID=3870 RepID=A0A6A4PAP7_LUPAL|nr:hypothetical protein Lalb_Chr17g0345481 [Lupinus albus]
MKLLWFIECLLCLVLFLIHPSIAPRVEPPPSGRDADMKIKPPPAKMGDPGTHP